MVDSINASEEGLRIVDQARRKKRWNKTAEAWCIRGFTSRATLSRFWAGQPIRKEIFVAICEAVGANWQEVATVTEPDSVFEIASEAKRVDSLVSVANANQTTNSAVHYSHQDWGDAPATTRFYGRANELAMLNQWIGQEQCRLVALLGMGGMGKTALAAKAAQLHQQAFECVIWRNLRNAPLLETLLADLLQSLSPLPAVEMPATLDGKILQLLKELRTHRCLLVLDGVESILQDGGYRNGYEEYGPLFTCIGETQHQSCLVLTTREMPKSLLPLEGETLPVRCLSLKGVTWIEGQQIFQDKGSLTGTAAEWATVVERYAGNPLVLKLIVSTIRSMFGGSLAYFLTFVQNSSFLVDEVRDLIEEHIDRLNPLEQDLLCWFAIHPKPMTIEEVQEGIASPLSTGKLMQAIAALQRHCLLEITTEQTAHAQQSLVLKYTTNALIQQMIWGMNQQHIIGNAPPTPPGSADTKCCKNNRRSSVRMTSSQTRRSVANERMLILTRA
jgi:hypothetical protein